MVHHGSRALLAIAVLAVGAAGLDYWFTRNAGREAGEPAPPVVASAAPDSPSATPAPDAAPAAVEAAPDLAAPTMDVVRVGPDGASVVAGRAAPGAKVTISADAAPLAEATADAAGNFVAIFRAQPAAVPRTLTLDAEAPDGTRKASEQVVVLLPTVPETAPAATAAADVAATAAPAAEPAGAAPEVASVAVVGPDETAVMPAARPNAATKGITLASISYEEAGAVRLAGLGKAGAQLRAYVDDAFTRDGTVGADGRWSIDLKDVAAGIYRLRIDQLGSDGKVASRVETPFQRDYPHPRPARAGNPGEVAGVGTDTVIVQPGTNLWTIARIRYGAGMRYTQIFVANRDLIRDPDLIYPGQIFALPAEATQ